MTASTHSLPAFPSGIGLLRGISCPTRNDCWAVGTTLPRASRIIAVVVATADGGTTWTSEPMPSAVATGYLNAVSCPSPTECIAIGATAGTAAKDYSVTILRTADGGTSLSSEPVPRSIRLGDLYGVSCPTTTDCWAAGSTVAAAPTANGAVLVTTDGGSTWSTQVVPDPSLNSDLSSISCPTTTDCRAIGWSVVATGNGGKTWAVQASAKQLGGYYSYGMSCPTTSDCWAIGMTPTGSSAEVASTTDGGKTWSSKDRPTPSGDNAGVSCPSSRDCWVGGMTVLGTTNAGRTWSLELPQKTTSPADFLGVSCPTVRYCWVVGDNTASAAGIVMATTNGGKTWKSET